MDDFIQITDLYDVFLRSTAKLTAISRQPEVTNTSCAKLTLLRYSSGIEPGDSSPVHISPWYDITLATRSFGLVCSPPGGL